MAELFRDRVFAILASGIDAVATVVQLNAGQGARFGTIPGGDFIRAALINSSGQIEIVKITARSTDQLTITRNAEGGGALSFVAGDRIECRIGPTSLDGFSQAAHLQSNEKKFGVNTGSVDALVVTLPATTVIALVNGMEVDVELTGANTTGAATLKVVLGATDTGFLPILKNGPGPNLLALKPGDLPGANAMAKFQYNADLASWVLLNPAGAASLTTEDQALTGGVVVTSKNLGTISAGTVTPDPGDRPMQHYTNGGAHTLAPSANAGSVLVDITNNASAGAIATSGFNFVTGDAFTTTNGNKFRCHISIGAAGSLLQVQALQ